MFSGLEKNFLDCEFVDDMMTSAVLVEWYNFHLSLVEQNLVKSAPAKYFNKFSQTVEGSFH